MSTKLIQKHILKGTREFEIVDDVVNIRTKSPFKEDMLTVTLAVLNPEPVISRSQVEFVSRVNGEALISLALSKPNVKEFNDFLNTLKQRAQAEYNTYSGMSLVSRSAGQPGGLPDAPPEFDDISTEEKLKGKKIEAAALEEAIGMLEQYATADEIKPLINALRELMLAPEDHDRLVDVAKIFERLGSGQGAVLAYAPYVGIILADDPFGF